MKIQKENALSTLSVVMGFAMFAYFTVVFMAGNS
jgi:hypothetical protein